MKFAIVMTALLGSVAAFADGTPVASKPVNFEALKLACKDPGSQQRQVRPTNITVTCNDVQYKWVPGNTGSMNLPTGRSIVFALTSDKYTVSPNAADIRTADQVASCPRYNQVSETIGLTKGVTCEELNALPEGTTGTQYCQILIDDARNNNPDAIKTVVTGRSMDFCSGAQGREQRPNK